MPSPIPTGARQANESCAVLTTRKFHSSCNLAEPHFDLDRIKEATASQKVTKSLIMEIVNYERI